MQQIVNFLISNRNGLLFLILIGVGIFLNIQAHDHHRGRFIGSANALTGSILSQKNEVEDYFSLAEQNKRLRDENAYLRSQLSSIADSLVPADSLALVIGDEQFNIIPATVLKNQYTSRNNYLTIRMPRGYEAKPDQGVIGPSGIVGIVDVVNGRFVRVVSILSSSLSVNTRIANSSVIGSLTWDGRSPYLLKMIDVPRRAQPVLGDTIYTGVQSLVFPPDIPVGTIQAKQLTNSGSLYELDIEPINDFTDLGTVYVVENDQLTAIMQTDTLGRND